MNASELEKCDDSIRVIDRVEPKYPTDVIEEKKVQFVRLSFLVDLEGKVNDVKVLELSNRRFGRTAIKTIKNWLFEPQKRVCGHEVKLEWVLSE